MIEGAQSSYPTSAHPTLSFAVADCSKSLPVQAKPYDIIFAGWFLNYASSASDLVSMFRVIADNLTANGRFVGITTNVLDPDMRAPKPNFYGLDIEVLDADYKDPETGERLGIKARVIAHTEYEIKFDVFQFTKEVYEQCAKGAGLVLKWREPVLPEGKWEEGYWDKWVERATFVVVEAVVGWGG